MSLQRIHQQSSPSPASHGSRAAVASAKPPHALRWGLITLKGINYRANVYLDGVKIAGNDTVVGSFVYFDFSFVPHGEHTLAVEVARPHDQVTVP